jgi:hypothetical protein
MWSCHLRIYIMICNLAILLLHILASTKRRSQY